MASSRSCFLSLWRLICCGGGRKSVGPAVSFIFCRWCMLGAMNVGRLLALTLLAPAFSTYGQRTPQLPLHTHVYEIVDAANHPLRLKSVNWYGFDEKESVVGGLDHASLASIVRLIQQMGFNSVRP